MNARTRYALSWVLWPLLLVGCLGLTGYGFSLGWPILYFNIAYVSLMIALFWAERVMPHEPLWNNNDGQIGADILHTLTSKGTVQALLYANGVIGVSMIAPNLRIGFDLWPGNWPLPLQIALAVVVSEFGLYWAHRTAHEHKFLWRFHAIHHSVTRLWFVNTGRFHFMDSVYKIVLGLAPLLLMGAPMEIIKWVAVVTAFIGLMTHCNVEMRFGPISWVFNTPELHRWHHSKDLREGDKNYGENILLWDWVFGTYFHENRRPPLDIGIKEPMPAQFRYQIIWPFLSKKRQAAILARLGEGAVMRSAPALSEK